MCPEDGRRLRADLELSPSTLDRAALKDREPTMWRDREVLPPCERVTLGEGLTPLWPTPRWGANWFLKAEGWTGRGTEVKSLEAFERFPE